MYPTSRTSDPSDCCIQVCDHIMRPWDDDKLSAWEVTAYTVASVILAVLTGGVCYLATNSLLASIPAAFVFHIVYNLVHYLVEDEPTPQAPPMFRAPQPEVTKHGIVKFLRTKQHTLVPPLPSLQYLAMRAQIRKARRPLNLSLCDEFFRPLQGENNFEQALDHPRSLLGVLYLRSGLREEYSCETFKKVLKKAKHLKSIQIAVSSLDPSLSSIQSPVHAIRITVPSLSEASLRSLWAATPQLEKLIIHTKENSLDFDMLDQFPQSLKFLTIVIDSPSNIAKKTLEKEGIRLVMTHVDSTSLLDPNQIAHPSNFEQDAFYQLLQIYKQMPENLDLLLKKLMKQTFDVEILMRSGSMFANQFDPPELEAFAHNLNPYTFESGNSVRNLEIFLRSAVNFCTMKINETDYDAFWVMKRGALLQLLMKHSVIWSATTSFDPKK